MMKIIYCAYGRAALECLDQLMLNFDIKKSDIIVYTHDIENNKEFIEHLIKNKFTYLFDNINNTFKQLKTFNPDYLISVYYRTIINYKILNLFNKGSMNLHPSLLPKYKGAKSSVWAILKNEKQTGISFHLITSNVDSGNIILQKKININNDDTAYSLYHKLISLFVTHFSEAFNLLISGYKGQKQTGESSYYSRKLPFDGRLDSNKVSYNEASQFVKAMYFPPFKGALLLIKNEEIEISSINDLRRHMGIS